MKRRDFLRTAATGSGVGLLGGAKGFSLKPAEQVRPNVILILTDDQGYGDVGFHGNTRIRTPQLDKLAGESVELAQFYSQPVCAPTRAGLLTGRYNYRTGVVDTYLGRAMMHPDEVTLAELLSSAGYQTGIFGKWHLGDNYPLRPIDQGFQEALVHRGGGIGQPSDPPGGDHYQDPWLSHNGKEGRFKGYCTDIFTNAATEFIRANRNRPFFVYLTPNAPHTPLEISEAYVEPYRRMDLDETTARVYGMVTNLDENVGRLVACLNELQLSRNTILIFVTDNGPQQERYRGSLRGLKGSVYEGGIRVPFLLRWPARLNPCRIATPAGHVDVLPTVLEACGVSKPAGLKIDGTNLLPLLAAPGTTWPDRDLFAQWHRGDEPILYRDFAVRRGRYKLVGHLQADGKPSFELFNLQDDPAEQNDMSAKQVEVVACLRKSYESWFRDVSSTRGYAPPRIIIGSPHENPVVLTRQDWRGPRAGWRPDALGHWEVRIARPGTFRIRCTFSALEETARIEVKVGSSQMQQGLSRGETTVLLPPVELRGGDARVEGIIHGSKGAFGVHYVEIELLSD